MLHYVWNCAECSKQSKKNRNNPEKNNFLQQIHYGFFCKKVYDNTRFGRMSINKRYDEKFTSRTVTGRRTEYSGWKGSDIFWKPIFQRFRKSWNV